MNSAVIVIGLVFLVGVIWAISDAARTGRKGELSADGLIALVGGRLMWMVCLMIGALGLFYVLVRFLKWAWE